MGTQALPQDRLVAMLAELPSCLVAFSGGVDSAVVAKAAHLALGDEAVAVTGVSASLASGELEAARSITQSIGIRHEIVRTDEFNQDDYLENLPNRCWHCKTELYTCMQALGKKMGIKHILNGANADDGDDFRPGMKAAAEQQVSSPLAECGFDKTIIRQIAQAWNIEVWDKHATPCLSSRMVYGLRITPDRLARIDAAEKLLRELGLGNIRVRYHHDDLARLEVALDDLPTLCEEAIRTTLTSHLRELGFRYITLDLEGFRSGSFQQLIPTTELTLYANT